MLPELPFPHTCLIVSGGHTELVQVAGLGQYTIVGETRDDAAGEAFDKGARLLGLGYPGGRAIQEAALSGDPSGTLPRGLSGETMNFSFSGLKTAVLRLVEREGAAISVPDAAASLQEAIVSVLVDRAMLRMPRARESRARPSSAAWRRTNRCGRGSRARVRRKASRSSPTRRALHRQRRHDRPSRILPPRPRESRDGWDLDTLPNSPLP